MALLEIKDLRTHFFLRRGVVKAVDGISFTVDSGETLGIVGESGSGKTITALSIMRLVPSPGKSIAGTIILGGEDLLKKSESEMRRYRGKYISQILQDPLSSLNPVFSIGNQVGEGIILHEHLKGRPLRDKVIGLLKRLGIPGAEKRIKDYPHQFSGGMRQRVVGAICIACRPQFLIADEPTTSLDVTIQMQYLNLLKEIQQRDKIGMLVITHDFGIVAYMCDRVAVMYAGRIVEMADVKEIFDHSAHPYTIALMNSVPKMDVRVDRLYSIKGQPPSLLNIDSGCAFRDRCPDRFDKCVSADFPPEAKITSNHTIQCWKYV